MIDTRNFGVLPDGRMVTCYTIHNQEGEFVELLDFGAALHGAFVRDRAGSIGNVVLRVQEAGELLGRSREGVTIGRCANRIAFGRFTIDGKTTQLETNSNGHFIHGASGNYAFRWFSAAYDPAGQSVCFSLRDDGQGGFDCAVDVKVTFSFGGDHCLEINYDLFPHGDTVLCPTNHAYFNLAGAQDVRDHTLRIFTSQFAPKADIGMPTGDVSSVSGLPLDFRKPRTLRDAMSQDPSGYFKQRPERYDDFYILDQREYGQAAELASPQSGRRMRVYTDMPALILNTPAPANPPAAHAGVYTSLCLETQFVPNAVNCPQYASPIFRRGERLLSRTVYEFSTFS